jgi:aryl-alcohol dehydrogenase-like predicted oxidoreductase
VYANQPIVDLVKEIAERKEATPGQIALAWLLAKSPHIVPIPGTRKTERVRENIKAAEVTLDVAEVEEIDARSRTSPSSETAAAATRATADGQGHHYLSRAPNPPRLG